ncbi:FAD-dependent oxidoreductase [Candidatus Saccharibacteria bacterium]|nr:FAD-dependent oxidoreductase [Candidatus Saccharibacteria bacterium]
MMKEYDVIIIGGGMAGLTAGIYVARAGKSVLVLESNVIGGQIVNSSSVENWPGDYRVSGADLMKKISGQATELGAVIRYEKTTKISKNGEKFVVVTDESEYNCGAVIIATGTEPRKLSGKQAEDVGERPISYCAICDGALYKNKPVAVVGGGNTAIHEMKYLEGICSKVYSVHYDDSIPKDAEAVFVAIGRVPATGYLDGFVELNDDGYIVASEDCKTSCPGVFVAGDCRTKSVRQLVTASGDGAIAAAGALDYLRK